MQFADVLSRALLRFRHSGLIIGVNSMRSHAVASGMAVAIELAIVGVADCEGGDSDAVKGCEETFVIAVVSL